MRDFCLLLLLFCAFAEAYWEEKNWWWDTLWEEEWLEEEPGEVSSGDPAAKKYSRIGFDATWQLAGLTLLCSGEDGLEAYPWQMRDNFHYQTLDLKTDFKLLNYHLLTWLDKQERRQFPYNPTRNYHEAERALEYVLQTKWPVEVVWRLGQGYKTFPRQSRYNSQSTSRGVEMWGKGKGSSWQFKVKAEQLEKIFPQWQAQSYLRDSITYSGTYRPKSGWRFYLKGEAWVRQYPLEVMETSKKNQWEFGLELPIVNWQTEVTYLSRLQRYPYQPLYDYFLTRGRVGLSRNFGSRRQVFVGYTNTRQAYFQREKSFAENSVIFRWQEKLGQLQLVIRCEVGERTDLPNPYLIQMELMPE
ncbi:MAG: hypothetical protein GX766_07695 [Firmicutes bacterium]|jgi:hypothetical protein|nr:hypothetical protein [Bacillota bacterium]HQD39134.1 hypothetical protein [Bacillota bacterium]